MCDGEVDERTTDKLALLPSVKRQVHCVGNRLKMDKHKAPKNNSAVAPKSVGSLSTIGHKKSTFRVKRRPTVEALGGGVLGSGGCRVGGGS